MPLKYALHPNHLTRNPTKYRAVTHHEESYTVREVIDRMIRRGSTVTRADALSVIEEYEATILGLLADGCRVNTALFRTGWSISGTFEGTEDHFEPERHHLNLNFSRGVRARDLHERLELQKIKAERPTPVPQTFTDATTSSNEQVTPGGVATIRGRRLKISPEAPRQGVFFIGTDGTEVQVDQFIRNMPKELIFTIPDPLPPGPCAVEVRAQLRQTTDVRTGRLDERLQST